MDEQAKLRYLKDIDYFSAKLESNPASKVFMPLALAYLRLDKFDEVINVCQAGLDHNPDYIAAKTVMAQAFLGKGLREEAKGLLIEVATLNKNNYRSNKLLGEIYRAEENPEKALYYYRTALLNAPEDSELRRLVEELAGITDLKPATLEEIEYEQKNTEEQVAVEDDDALLTEVNELADELAESGLMDEADSAQDLLDIEEQIAKMVHAADFDGARDYVRASFAGDIEYQEKKLKEIDAEEALLGTGEPALDSLDMEEAEGVQSEVQNEIIIPDEDDDLDLDNVFGDDFDLSADDDVTVDSGPAEMDLASEMDLDLTDPEADEPSELDLGLTDSEGDISSELDLDLSDVSPEEITPEMDVSFISEAAEDVSGEVEESTAAEAIEAIDEEMDFDNLLDEKIDIAEDELIEAEEKLSTEVAQADELAIQRLEDWMTNISKRKSSRNVH